jgi:hypothetical protein
LVCSAIDPLMVIGGMMRSRARKKDERVLRIFS